MGALTTLYVALCTLRSALCALRFAFPIMEVSPMSRPMFDSEYLYGLHDPGGEQLMLDAGAPGGWSFPSRLTPIPTTLAAAITLPFQGVAWV